MSIVVIIVIYLVFISLGLPDSFIGSSWPSIVESLNISVDMQGILTFTIAICTIISAFLTNKLSQFLKTGIIVSGSIILTAVGLICSYFAPNLLVLFFCMIPLGLGAGAIDTTLNNFVAINYKAIHLNWLHAAWGIGASSSPIIISIFLTDINGWRNGALVLGLIQAGIFLISLVNIPLYDKITNSISRDESKQTEEDKKIGFFKSFTIKGVLFAIAAFFAYIAVEQMLGLWFTSMSVYEYGVENAIASQWTSLFYFGIVVGRIISGLISLKIKDKNIIRVAEVILFISIILMTLGIKQILPYALFIAGFSCGPIYPCIIHATPDRFTKQLSMSVMSIQVGCAYIANITVAPLFGVIAKATSFLILPYVLLGFTIIMILGNEVVLIKTKNKEVLLK